VRVFWEERHGDYKAGTDYWETFRDPQCLKIMGEQNRLWQMLKESNFLRGACWAWLKIDTPIEAMLLLNHLGILIWFADALKPAEGSGGVGEKKDSGD
jgi:hypothetical protein